MNEEQLAAEATSSAAEAYRKGYDDALEIVELCTLVGKPEQAAALLAKSAAPAEARQHLLAARMADDAVEIQSHVMPDSGTRASAKPEDSPVVKAVERLAGKGVK